MIKSEEPYMELSYDNRNDSFIPSLADDENSETGEIVS